jgi:hypothetical protein
MTLGELAAYVCTHLRSRGIETVLSGGGCVAIYSDNKYRSYDLDFIENVPTNRRRICEILSEIGFVERDRCFVHQDTEYMIEFPAGPLAVGSEPIRKIEMMEFATGLLALLSPTDCVKDRLAAFYHWDDRQCLEQALLVTEQTDVDLEEIRRWSAAERQTAKYKTIRADLARVSKKRMSG